MSVVDDYVVHQLVRLRQLVDLHQRLAASGTETPPGFVPPELVNTVDTDLLDEAWLHCDYPRVGAVLAEAWRNMAERMLGRKAERGVAEHLSLSGL